MTDMPDWDDDILGEETTDDSLIELTDVVSESSAEVEDGLIELTDVVDESSAKAEDADGLIELTDVVEVEPEEVEQEGTIELTDIVSEEGSDLDLDDASEDIDFDLDDTEVQSLDATDDFIDEEVSSFDDEPELEELQLPEEVSVDEPVVEKAAAGISMTDVSVPELNVGIEDIEAALDRVIEKKFGDKIETILFEVIEKVIEKEIIQIKNSLKLDLDQVENG